MTPLARRAKYAANPGGGDSELEMAEPGKPRRTPFYTAHLALGARMIEFFGWEMPVQYGGIIQEHRCVRSLSLIHI